MSLPEQSIRVVGVAYPNNDGGNRRTEIMFCNPGEFIELRLEPNNRVDPNAIAVFSARGHQIGYLPADRAAWIAGMMRIGRDLKAIFQSAEDYGAVLRVAFDGKTPTLPHLPDRPAPANIDELYQGDSDFEPDWFPPDD